jgi:hypothetical protein
MPSHRPVRAPKNIRHDFSDRSSPSIGATTRQAAMTDDSRLMEAFKSKKSSSSCERFRKQLKQRHLDDNKRAPRDEDNEMKYLYRRQAAARGGVTTSQNKGEFTCT